MYAQVSALLAPPTASTAAPSPVNYIYFGRGSQRNYRASLRSRTRLEVGAPLEWAGGGGNSVALTRLPQFCDGTHLAGAAWY